MKKQRGNRKTCFGEDITLYYFCQRFIIIIIIEQYLADFSNANRCFTWDFLFLYLK